MIKLDEKVEYALRYGGRCRDCADHLGVCPGSGLPCNVDDARRAIKHVLDAIDYGTKHAYFAAVPSTDEGLALANAARLLHEAAKYYDSDYGYDRARECGQAAEKLEALASLASGAKPVAGEPVPSVTNIYREAEPLLRDLKPIRTPSPDVAGLEPAAELVAELRQGVRPEGGMSNDIELYGIDDANQKMDEAATALEASASQLSALQGELRKAEDRIDELEREADNVAVDFEKEITGAVWALLRRLDADLSDGMNAGQAVEWLDLHIRELTARAERQLAAEKGP